MNFFDHLKKWIRIVSDLKYGLAFLALVVLLPFTAFSSVPGHRLLGGLFLELRSGEVFFLSLSFFAATWSAMYAVGLLAADLERGQYPETLRRFLTLPIELPQFLIFTALAVIDTLVVVERSPEPGWSTLTALLGAVVAYLLMVVLAGPAHLVYESLGDDEDPLPSWFLTEKIWKIFGFSLIRVLIMAFHRLISRLFAIIPLLRPALYKAGNETRLRSAHFLALTTGVGTFAILILVARLFFPPRIWEPLEAVSGASGGYLYGLLILLVWIVPAMAYYLAPLRLSPLLVLFAGMMLIYNCNDIDHDYDATEVTASSPAEPLTPVKTVETSRGGDNLVVVTSTGGGIMASGWTTLALGKMVADRPRVVDEIRLLSTVSGGSVGAVHYTLALRSWRDDPGLGLEGVLSKAFSDSTGSSLPASAYGLAFLDFPRFFPLVHRLPVLREWDRGRLLEDSWAEIVGGEATLLEIRPRIAAGELPALILNTTVMERGHRLMLTPVTFPQELAARAPTQTDYLGEGGEVDMNLWTAARLSATFPYVSPAARSNLGAEVPCDKDTNTEEPGIGCRRRYHMIDGGFYDNHGVASMLDWLDPVLEARYEKRLDFKKILVVQLNPFPPPPAPVASSGAGAAVLGPLLGIFNIRDGVQETRNRIDLHRVLDTWQSRYAEAGIDVCFKTVTLQPEAEQIGADGEETETRDKAPLSWHLTERQIRNLELQWDDVAGKWDDMQGFLDGPCGSADDTPSVTPDPAQARRRAKRRPDQVGSTAQIL